MVRMPRGLLVASAFLMVLGVGQQSVRAQTPVAGLLAPSVQSYHAWQVPPPQGSAQAYFVNLNVGDKIETPFVLKFGLSGGWGLAPISAPIGGKSGHHHLLVNRDLPLDFKQPLPFNDQYIHFGKGQMETVLNLAPGTYTLRLLLADDKHLPHFVYSKPISVSVVKKNSTDPATLARKGVSLGLTGDTTGVPFRVQMHASGLNVGHLAQKQKDTGHFRLTVTPAKGQEAVMDFVNGQTEVWLSPPAGDYAVKLEFVDNANPGKSTGYVASGSVKVK
jgi:hypothetical protein